ncbi:glycerophosphoryl diester phosphodiesterase membrane domain-containing protein [Phenylobacterium sp.]|uniref:glycerophosphoryl diester phosphodiesterase membrane domain-containing protein n=1 Tax=Phenylobacterium sp. TaxID=1871053 RepID=UPI00273636FB|nr:glycerophosphoryl diester phosphodiesterase membrane domain-containing protein [Phenylobacterium sp.]MDP3660823.1 glycerophosphoryl diester phosphodiesterase membrane domain-containing protein [Phenylobacterium sp.]
MSKFSPSEAALEGFRLTRERPGLIATWAGLYFLGIMLLILTMGAALGPQFVALMRESGGQIEDTDALGDLLAQSWPAFIIVASVAVFFWSMLKAAIYRSILRPEDSKFAYVRIGMDEVRLAVGQVVLGAIGILFLIGLDFPLSALRAGGHPSMWLLAAVIVVGMVWMGIRLSLTMPLIFYEKKVKFMSAWNLSKGSFWSILGMCVLSLIFYIMIFILVYILMTIIVALSGGMEAVKNISRLTPVSLAAFIITSVIVPMIMPVIQAVTINAPFAVAYGELAGVPTPHGRRAAESTAVEANV